MIFFEREKQCQNCCHECGWDEAQEQLKDGTIVYEHCFDCKLGNKCDSDVECSEFAEE